MAKKKAHGFSGNPAKRIEQERLRAAREPVFQGKSKERYDSDGNLLFAPVHVVKEDQEDELKVEEEVQKLPSHHLMLLMIGFVLGLIVGYTRFFPLFASELAGYGATLASGLVMLTFFAGVMHLTISRKYGGIFTSRLASKFRYLIVIIIVLAVAAGVLGTAVGGSQTTEIEEPGYNQSEIPISEIPIPELPKPEKD